MDFARQENIDQLAIALGSSTALVQELVDNKSKHIDRLQLPKKNRRGYRQIVRVTSEAASLFYSNFGKQFGLYSERMNLIHPAATAYRKGYSIRRNAQPHCGCRLLLKGDIKEFFKSIAETRLALRLVEIGISDDMARILSSLLCVDGSLALGLNPSPVAANIVCREMDEELSRLLSTGEDHYTRYADDLSFSSQTRVPDLEAVYGVLRAHQFVPNEQKFRVLATGQSMYVTGVSVSDTVPRAPRRMKQELRQELYFARTRGYREHIAYKYPTLLQGFNRISGRIAYVKGIEPDHGTTLQEEWAALVGGADSFHSANLAEKRLPRSGVFLIDETVFGDSGEEQVLALCVCVIDASDRDFIEANLAKSLSNMKAYPHGGTSVDKLDKEGLHWTSLAEDERVRLSAALETVPVRAFIAFDVRRDDESKGDWYMRILDGLIGPRLSPFVNGDVRVLFEEMQDINSSFGPAMERIYLERKVAGERVPATAPSATRGSKSDILLSIPDSMLGIWRRFMSPNAQEFE